MFEPIRIRKCLTIIVLCVLFAACSAPNRIRTPDKPNPVIKGDVNEETVKRALEMKLGKQISYLNENRDEFKKQVVPLPSRDVTYYYKFYEEFPEGPDAVDVTVSPTGGFSPAYKADANYRKIRYQTRYTKSKGRAANDEDFIRDEGVQKEKYEFDGEIWKLKSSVYEVTKTSVYQRNRWRTTQDRIRRIEDEEPELFVDKVRNLFGLLD